MLDHLELLFGPVGAVATTERLLLGVRQEVMSEACWPAECFVAQTALVRAVIAVLMLMRLQYKTGLEGFAAFLAHVRARFTVLCVPVCTESIGPIGAVITLITGMRLISCKIKVWFKCYFRHVEIKLPPFHAVPVCLVMWYFSCAAHLHL